MFVFYTHSICCICVCIRGSDHLNRLQIEESTKPMRLSQKLDKAVTSNYKPVANHENNVRNKDHICLLFHELQKNIAYYQSLKIMYGFQSICIAVTDLWSFLFSSSMRRERRRRAREHELTNSRCWTCCFLLLRSTSTTTSKTWWISPNSLW